MRLHSSAAFAGDTASIGPSYRFDGVYRKSCIPVSHYCARCFNAPLFVTKFRWVSARRRHLSTRCPVTAGSQESITSCCVRLLLIDRLCADSTSSIYGNRARRDALESFFVQPRCSRNAWRSRRDRSLQSVRVTGGASVCLHTSSTESKGPGSSVATR